MHTRPQATGQAIQTGGRANNWFATRWRDCEHVAEAHTTTQAAGGVCYSPALRKGPAKSDCQERLPLLVQYVNARRPEKF